MTDPNLLESYFTAAREAGCSADQVTRFASAGYVAIPSMLAFHAAARRVDDRSFGVTEILLDGTRGSAKSHAVLAQVFLDDCQLYPGLKWLFLRQTERAAGESFGDLVSRVLRNVPHKSNTERVQFPNGSRVVIGGFKDASDIDKYQGVEYDGMVIEEGTQINGERIERLFGSLRTSREDWVPRAYVTTNPGGVGHVFFKMRYIDPQRQHRETTTRRFFSSYADNPFINPEYRRYLEGLTGDLARMWRDGDWDVFAGMALSAWRHDKHVIKPFEIPSHWSRWRAVDWGYSAPWCCLWFARNPDNGRTFVYREAYQTGLTDTQQARAILDMTPPSENITVTFADPSMWAVSSKGSVITSSADEYRSNGVVLTRADNDRLSGKRKVDRMLEPLPDGLPGIQIFENCLNVIRTLPTLTYDKTHTEDVDTDQEDHAYDAVRYGLTQVREYRTRPANSTPNPWTRMENI